MCSALQGRDALKKMLTILEHAYNPSTQEMEAEDRESSSAWIRTQSLSQKQTNKKPLPLCFLLYQSPKEY